MVAALRQHRQRDRVEPGAWTPPATTSVWSALVRIAPEWLSSVLIQSWVGQWGRGWMTRAGFWCKMAAFPGGRVDLEDDVVRVGSGKGDLWIETE